MKDASNSTDKPEVQPTKPTPSDSNSTSTDKPATQDEVMPKVKIPYYKPKSQKHKASFIVTHLASVFVIGLIWLFLIAIILWFVCCRKKRKVSKAVKRAKKPITPHLKIVEK